MEYYLYGKWAGCYDFGNQWLWRHMNGRQTPSYSSFMLEDEREWIKGEASRSYRWTRCTVNRYGWDILEIEMGCVLYLIEFGVRFMIYVISHHQGVIRMQRVNIFFHVFFSKKTIFSVAKPQNYTIPPYAPGSPESLFPRMLTFDNEAAAQSFWYCHKKNWLV